jgi:formate dehydrogenase major subunit
MVPCAPCFSRRMIIRRSRPVSRISNPICSVGRRWRISRSRGIRIHSAVPPGLLFIAFCYAEAAANILTNPQLDPFGKIPEFKYCAARIERVGQPEAVAAE